MLVQGKRQTFIAPARGGRAFCSITLFYTVQTIYGVLTSISIPAGGGPKKSASSRGVDADISIAMIQGPLPAVVSERVDTNMPHRCGLVGSDTDMAKRVLRFKSGFWT